jgi:conjugal transfer mating pair stabilization protein TraG
MVSGYMLAMIPVLAIFITKGLVSSIGNMANSMMYIPQTAAVQSAEQSVKGNYSLGNTNIDTHAYDTLNAHKFDDNYSWLSGMKSWAMMSGSVQKEYADGRQGMDIMPSPANLGGLNIVTSNMIGGKIESTETDLTNKADRYAHSSNESLTHGMSTFFGYNQQASQHESAVNSLQQNLTSEERQSFDTTKAFVEKLAKDHGISADLALRVTGMASSPKILPFSASAELSGTTGARTAYNEAKEAFKDEKFAESFNKTVSMIETKSHQTQIGQSKDLTDSISTDFKQSHQADRSYAKTMEELHSLQETKSAYQTRSTEITQNLNNQFLEYAIAKYGHDAFEQAVRRDPAEARKMGEEFIETLKLPDLVQIKTKAQFADKHQLQSLKTTTFTPEEVQAAKQKQEDGRTEIITTQAVPKELTELENDPKKTNSQKTLNVIAKADLTLQNNRNEQNTRVGEKIDTGKKSMDKKSDALKIGKKEMS